MTKSTNRITQVYRAKAMLILSVIVIAGCCMPGCATSGHSRLASTNPNGSASVIKREIWGRSNSPVHGGQTTVRTRGLTSPGVATKQPLSIDGAIGTALANNKGFQATLAQMGMAEGDYLQSTLLTNPQLNTMIPVGVKQWEWTLYLPIEAFLLRPEKMDLADKDRKRIANQLVQTGLTLVRDVSVAYTNLALATEQQALALETLQILKDLKDLTEKRLEDGDIAELEAIQTRVDALNAKANAALLEQNVKVAREQLALLMGVPEQADQLRAFEVPDCHVPAQSVEKLIAHASANRPDFKAAEWAVAAAERRLALARKAWWRFDGVADYNSSGAKGPEVGPGLRFDIPFFNKNEGGIMRACAELDAAKYNRNQIQDQIVNQVRLAYTQAQQASENVNALQTEVLPALDEALEIARKGFEDGGTSYLLVLQTTSQYVDVKSRMLDQSAARCRASADLELSCGGRLRIFETYVGESTSNSETNPLSLKIK